MSGLDLCRYVSSDSESDYGNGEHEGEAALEEPPALARNQPGASASGEGFAVFGQKRRPALARKNGLPLFKRPIPGDSSDSSGDVRCLDFLST
jgi:hypothetical protein